MLKINRAYLDACGYVDGVFEELLIKPVGEGAQPVHHVIHAPNGVGKTTILALLFSIFEPDRRKFLRTEINRQHKIEDYFMPGRLGIVALELVKPGVNNQPVRHVIGQVFWLTAASKGDDGEPGLRRFFGLECNDDLSLEGLPFRGLGGQSSLRSLDDFSKWAREMRSSHATFYATDSLAAWRRFLTDELGIDLKLVDVQRRFCAKEGGIGATFLDFKTEQQFLEKVFSFMIPANAAEGIIATLETALSKIRGLPQRKEQHKALTRLAQAFDPFATAAAALEAAETEREEDFLSLGRLFSRLKLERSKLEAENNTVEGEILLKDHELRTARSRLRTVQGEVLFLEKAAADRRFEDAKAEAAQSKERLSAATRSLKAARAADLQRKLASAEVEQADLEAELARIERDLAPDRARLARAGANLHALLEHLAAEAEVDAVTKEAEARHHQDQAGRQQEMATQAVKRAHDFKAEVERLAARVAEHDRERKELERLGASKASEQPSATISRLDRERAGLEDQAAGLALEDEQLETETHTLEGKRTAALGRSETCAAEAQRLGRLAETGHQLERAICESPVLPAILAGEPSDPYKADLLDRVHTARALSEELRRNLENEREKIVGELAFLDAEGVSSVPEDVNLVVQALRDAGMMHAVPAEHYLAQYRPDADKALALLRSDPARFSGVFVSRLDRAALTVLAAENKLKLKGPVVVSEASLEASPDIAQAGVVFGPFSAARINKQAAADEKARLAAALEGNERDLAAVLEQITALQALIDNLRELRAAFGEERPGALQRCSRELQGEGERAAREARQAAERQKVITGTRSKIRGRIVEMNATISRLTGWIQHVEQFAKRYHDIASAAARIPQAAAEQRSEEEAARVAQAAAGSAREDAATRRTGAATLRERAQSRRNEKLHYPETDGGASDRIGTLEDLCVQYRNTEQILNSKRDAQQARVSARLSTVKTSVAQLTGDTEAATKGLTAADLGPFAGIADLERVILSAEESERMARDAVAHADAALGSASAARGPVSGKLQRALANDKLSPIEVPELAEAAAEALDKAAAAREELAAGLETEVRGLDRAHTALQTRHTEIKGKITVANAQVKNAEGHLPETHRDQLPDLSLRHDELEATLDRLVSRLNVAISAIQKLAAAADDAYEAIRLLIEDETFRRLEPQVADNLRRFTARSAARERVALAARIDERAAIVLSEIENQQRDQNACLEQLRLYVLHADDLLRRAARSSLIPDHVPIYGGDRILKVKRRLGEVPQDAIRSQLAVWLDEQVVMGRVPKDGAALAAELLNRAQSGRPLGIEILKPKREAIETYMPVDRIGVSNGEGVTLAMLLYTVIQKMALDERADGKNAATGGFLMLDNTYGTSNLMEHVVLQKTMADVLDIQLFVTTCVEDKHVLNMFPTITRLVQGERMFRDGAAQYIRVRAAEYLLREAEHAA
jgi:chromosome segregation ATPase